MNEGACVYTDNHDNKLVALSQSVKRGARPSCSLLYFAFSDNFMGDGFRTFGILSLIVGGLVVVPTLIAVRLTRRLSTNHRTLRFVIVPLPGIILLVFFCAFAWFYDRASAPKSAPYPSESAQAGGTSSASPPASSSAVAPVFPWPPPTPSARLVIPSEVFPRQETLGRASMYLESALNRAGYAEISYYIIPGGIAVVTRLEHIYPDGRPFESSERWLVDDESMQTLSLSAYVKELFAVDEGFYRVVVFVVSDKAFGASNRPVTREEATEWLSNGYNTLPSELVERPLSASHKCTALIYEFRKNHGTSPHLLIPSPLGATQHLAASGLLAAFSKRD